MREDVLILDRNELDGVSRFHSCQNRVLDLVVCCVWPTRQGNTKRSIRRLDDARFQVLGANRSLVAAGEFAIPSTGKCDNELIWIDGDRKMRQRGEARSDTVRGSEPVCSVFVIDR